jgi:hypothetical protein
MPRFRTYVAVVTLFAMLCFAGSAVALPRNNDRPRDPKTLSELQKQKERLKGWIVKILDDLESKLSWPPG